MSCLVCLTMVCLTIIETKNYDGDSDSGKAPAVYKINGVAMLRERVNQTGSSLTNSKLHLW